MKLVTFKIDNVEGIGSLANEEIIPFNQDASCGFINAGNSPGGAFFLNIFAASFCVIGILTFIHMD